jgi:hypothetical protein
MDSAKPKAKDEANQQRLTTNCIKKRDKDYLLAKL